MGERKKGGEREGEWAHRFHQLSRVGVDHPSVVLLKGRAADDGMQFRTGYPMAVHHNHTKSMMSTCATDAKRRLLEG
eukprot:COSAG05_NODE_292_length_12012_cov_12.968354_15_plen_77_part_00